MSELKNWPLLNALETERRYMAKELHDGVAQTTLQLGLQIAICRKYLERDHLDMLHSELRLLEERIRQCSGQVRELIQDLRPPVLDTETVDLQAYLGAVIDIHHQRGGTPVTFNFEISQELGLSETELLTLGRIVQEGLLNIRKHARAAAVQVSVRSEAGQLCLTITDDGLGFDTLAMEAQATDRAGAGLHNLKLRAEAIGGVLTLGQNPAGELIVTHKSGKLGGIKNKPGLSNIE